MKKYLLFLYTNEFVELTLCKKLGIEFLSQCEICYEKDSFLYVNDQRIKIAVVGLSEEPHIKKQNQTLVYDLSSFDLVIVYGREDVWKDIDSIKKEIYDLYNNRNICVLAAGIDFRTYSNDYFYPVLNQCKLTLLSSDNDNYSQENKREYLFDALLGTPKSHRQYIFYRLLDESLLTKSLVNVTVDQDYYKDDFHRGLWSDISQSYRSRYGEIEPYRSKFLDEIDNDFTIDNNTKMQVNQINTGLMTAVEDVFNKTNIGLNYYHRAYTTPYNVYKHSWYSILCETYQDYRFQPTEKTAKVMLGGRIFVCFTCRHFLKNLKKIGFKTFDSIIDESYDEIEDTAERFDMAWKQVKYLSQSDHMYNYKKVNDVINHNRSLVLDPTFQLVEIENFIYDKIKKISR